MIALKEMLARPRDGHTVFLCSCLDAFNTLLCKSAPCKVAGIAPIRMVSKACYAFTVPTSLPIKDMAGFIAYAKERPGQLKVPIASYGCWGMCAGSCTQTPAIDKLNAAVTAAVGSSDFKSAMEKSGTVAVSSTPEQLDGIMTETVKDFGDLIAGLGIKQLE